MMLPVITEKKTVAAIGKFDTFHLGHRELIRTCCKKAKEKNALSLILFIGTPAGDVITASEGESIARELGCELVLRQELDCDFRSLSADDFVKIILKDRLNCECVVVGDNFRFSKNRSADSHDLWRICKEVGIECIIIEEIKRRISDGKERTVSSTLVRSLISEGRAEDVALLLQRPYSITSKVERGKHIGSKLGFPTANLEVKEGKALFADGVYATYATVGKKRFPAVTNIGSNPTVGKNNKKTIETYLIGFEGDIYGETVTVEFLDRIRGEIKFSSLDELKKQIAEDIEYVNKKIQ